MTFTLGMTHRRFSGAVAAIVIIVLAESAGAFPVVGQEALGQEVPASDLTSAEPRVQDAIAEARQRVLATPDNGDAWGRYGMTLEAHRLLDQALTAYQRASELDAKRFEWAYFTAVLLEYQDPVKARPWHEKAIANDPSYAPARVHFGETLEKLGELEAADQEFEEAVRVDTNEPLGHFGRGRLALARGDLDAAVGHLERAYRLAPKVQAIVATLARAYHRSGERDRARELAQAARSLPRMTHRNDPRRARINDLAVNIQSYLHRSKTYREVGQLDRALGEIERVLEIDPELTEAHFAAAGLYDRMSQPQRAVSSARRALELDPGFVGARPVLAGALFKLGRVGEAREEAESVLSGEPDNFHMLVLSSLLAAQRGDVDSLLSYLDRAYTARSSDRDLRRVLRRLLIDLSDSLAAIGEMDDAAKRMEQVVQLAVEEGAPEAELNSLRRKLALFRR